MVNEVADNFFVIPLNAGNFGWKCKLLSVVLEVFQLGVLFPAAAFTHGDCLKFMDPLGVSMSLVRDTITVFGYAIWCSVLVIGAAAGLGVVIQGMSYGALASIPRITARWGRAGRIVGKLFAPLIRCNAYVFESTNDDSAACGRVFQVYMGICAVPMCVAGAWLGVLVIAAQAKKTGLLNFFTALVLFFDVSFKVGSTILFATWEQWQHHRERRRIGVAAAAPPNRDPLREPPPLPPPETAQQQPVEPVPELPAAETTSINLEPVEPEQEPELGLEPEPELELGLEVGADVRAQQPTDYTVNAADYTVDITDYTVDTTDGAASVEV